MRSTEIEFHFKGIKQKLENIQVLLLLYILYCIVRESHVNDLFGLYLEMPNKAEYLLQY